MGLFDFFKKKSTGQKQSETATALSPAERNGYVLAALKDRLMAAGYHAEKHPQYLSLIVNTDLEIATVIMDNPGYHPSLLHLMVVTIHPQYFPDGIHEDIVGIGASFEDKVNSVLDNYLNTTFQPIMDSFTDSHNPALDFTTMVNGKEVLWHPKMGPLTLQGQWSDPPQNEPFYELLKDKLPGLLTNNKLNWLKLYIARQADGSLTGECLFNNEIWKEGLEEIAAYAYTWKMHSDFQGMKQFMVFRRCDASDE